MKQKSLALLLALSLLLTGCSWMDGSYVSVEAHREHRQIPQTSAITAATYLELLTAMQELVAAGAPSATIQVSEYPADSLDNAMESAIQYIQNVYPIGAYAVEEIHYELGTSGGQPAVAVTVTYSRSLTEIRSIRTVRDMDTAETVIYQALERYAPNTVLMVESFADKDLDQLVRDYAHTHPKTVMETPMVTESVYGSGQSRLVELIFTYQNSRDDLRNMQAQVEPVFNAAVLYVSGDGADHQKYAQLYAFLMERFDYTIETSLTPAYSLLRHGVGDSRAFATVYAAMCRGAGLECMTVTGTSNGEPRTWNIVKEDGLYYHVDLLHSSSLGNFRTFTDAEMTGYVWDYSAYPACTGASVSETEPQPAAENTLPPAEIFP